MPTLFTDRAEAGHQLAKALEAHADRANTILLALPRGGVAVAAEMVKSLRLPLDLMIVRKLGAPQNPELALGAVAAGGALVLNDSVIAGTSVTRAELDAAVIAQRMEVEARNLMYREGRPSPVLEGQTVILVDDGMATGADMQAAVAAARQQRAARIIVAVPVTSHEALDRLRRVADEVVALSVPEPLFSVGAYYENFDQVPDEDVLDMLAAA